jgi:hypothetical protein
VADVASGTKMQKCNGKASSLLEEMWAAELAACLKRFVAKIAACSRDAKVWQQKWLLVWKMQKCGSRNSFLLRWCGSKTRLVACRIKSMAAEMAACLKHVKV